MNIGDFSRRVGLSQHTIRYYEKEGLLNEPPRKNGWRDYSKQDVRMAKMVAAGRKLGFSISDMKRLKTVVSEGNFQQSCIQEDISDKIESVKVEIQALGRLLKNLEEMSSCACENLLVCKQV
ncbi:MAG: MerR family transcriptional regulator [Pseudomonadota bacterium]